VSMSLSDMICGLVWEVKDWRVRLELVQFGKCEV